VLAADAAGEKLLAATFAHDEKGAAVAVPAAAAPWGGAGRGRAAGRAVVERLLDAGLRVLALHPTRSRTSAIGSQGSTTVVSRSDCHA
jgi:hypothetical protein